MKKWQLVRPVRCRVIWKKGLFVSFERQLYGKIGCSSRSKAILMEELAVHLVRKPFISLRLADFHVRKPVIVPKKGCSACSKYEHLVFLANFFCSDSRHLPFVLRRIIVFQKIFPEARYAFCKTNASCQRAPETPLALVPWRATDSGNKKGSLYAVIVCIPFWQEMQRLYSAGELHIFGIFNCSLIFCSAVQSATTSFDKGHQKRSSPKRPLLKTIKVLNF